MKFLRILLFLVVCPFISNGQTVTVTFTPITVDANTISFEMYASCPTTRYLAAIPGGWTYLPVNNFVGSTGSWVNGPGGNINLPGSYTFSGSPNYRIAYAQTATCPPANRFQLSSSPQLIGTFTIDLIPSVTFPFTATLRPSGANSFQVTTYPDNLNATGATVHTIAAGNLIADATTTFSSPLPVELEDIDAVAKPTNNLINWSTASELNSQFHIVERSADGMSDWKEIGRLNANGTTTTKHSYQLVDERPLTMSYYRLKMLDFDGKFEYSKVVNVERAVDGFAVTNVFPMPVNQKLTLQVASPESASLTITVTDLVGRTVSISEMDADKGVNNLELNTSGWASGTYYVNIDNGVTKLTERIVKQ